MNAQEFCYWLQGFMEVQNPEQLTPQQTQMVKDHLALVFTKVTPPRPVEQKKCSKELPPEVEKLLKDAQEELQKPPSRRRRIFPDGLWPHRSESVYPFNGTYC